MKYRYLLEMYSIVYIKSMSHLKLVFDLTGVGLRVQSADVVVNGSELTHWDRCVPTQTRFQDGVMHKHILLLQRKTEREREM